MNGEDLYECWSDNMDVIADTSVDSWGDLSEDAREVWQALADAINSGKLA